MIGHALYPQLDAAMPSSLSRAIVTNLLRGEMEFAGLVMTDDLDMGACHRVTLIEQAAQVPETMPGLDRALESIARFKAGLAAPTPFSEEAFGRLDAAVWQLRVDTLGAELAARRSPEDGKRSPVETY